MLTKGTRQAILTVGLLFALTGTAWAAPFSIAFEAHNLADLTAGEDLWQYEYFVGGGTFQADQGFSVYFSPDLYGSLSDPQTTNTDWDLIAIPPDPVLGSDGFIDALAFADGASLANGFTVSFVWLGAQATPGIQAVTINQFDASGNLEILERGQTVPTPEPSTLALLATAALGALHRLRGRRSVSTRR